MIDQIQKESPLAFKKWADKHSIKANNIKIVNGIDSVNIEADLGGPEKTITVKRFTYGDFFRYFQTVGIYGYVVPWHEEINYWIRWKEGKYTKTYQSQSHNFSWPKDQRTDCEEACIIKMAAIHNKILEGK